MVFFMLLLCHHGAPSSLPRRAIMPDRQDTDHRLADAPRRNLVDRFAPAVWKPYLRLARLDRPIGIWLLFWPCLWGLTAAALETGRSAPSFFLIMLFALGAILMRSAGCVFNDMADRDFDKRTPRTAKRPLATGEISLMRAALFLMVLCGLGAVVLFQMNALAISLGIASLGLVALYPFMKRITYWPQIFLGFVFNWGALMGFAAEAETLAFSAWSLYAAGIFWTLGYDTIYALQDRDTDALIGVKSSALILGDRFWHGVACFYGASCLCLLAAGIFLEAGAVYYLCLAPAAGHFVFQLRRLGREGVSSALSLFRSNRLCGALIALALMAEAVSRAFLTPFFF